MSYYIKRRYNPPDDVYRANTLIGHHTGKNALTPMEQSPSLNAHLAQFRADRSASLAANFVRESLGAAAREGGAA